MDLVHQVYLAVPLSELIFRIDKDKPLLSSYFRPTLENRTGIFLQFRVVLGTDQSAGDYLLPCNVFVVAFHRLGSRGYDRLRKLLVLHHPIRQLYSAQGPLSGLVLPPGVSGKISPDHHLHLERLTLQAHRYRRIRDADLPVRKDVVRGIQELGSNPVQYLPFVWYTLREDNVECRDPVGNHHHQVIPVYIINVADLADIFPHLSREIESSLNNCFHI